MINSGISPPQGFLEQTDVTEQTSSNSSFQVGNFFKKIGKGISYFKDEASFALNDIYSIEGFEKLSKAMVANLRATSLIFACFISDSEAWRKAFHNTLLAFDLHKDLCYATLVFASTADFITTVENAETGKIEYKLQPPKDVVKLLYGVGNFFETGKFLQRCELLNFPLCSRIASQLGSIQLFTLNGQIWKFGNIPVLNSWCDRPKDFFVFNAAAYTTYKCWKNPTFYTWENILKLISSIGKMALVASADFLLSNHSKVKHRNQFNKYILILTVMDVVTNNSALIGKFLKGSRERLERFNNPLKA